MGGAVVVLVVVVVGTVVVVVVGGTVVVVTAVPKAALTVFAAEVPKLSDQAYQLQYGGQAFAINNPIRDRLTQVLVGELTLDEAVERIQQDVDDALATASQ